MLDCTLSVDTRSDAVAFELAVTNEGGEDASLSFRDGQRVRFTVESADGGGTVWRSDEGQMFVQVLGEEQIPAGTAISFGEVWENPESGDYRVHGEITSDDEALTADEEFSV